MTKIIQVVGYKNSGKTTLMNKLIHHFSNEMRVGSLKHHGHGGEIDSLKHTDSALQFEAGAVISGVQGESITQLTLENLSFYELINIYESLSIDLLLIEGYKQASYPKIVLLKNKEDISLLDELSNIIAVGTNGYKINSSYPTFNLTNIDDEMTKIVSYITNS